MGDFVAAFKDISTLNTYAALENLSGAEDLYEQVLIQVIRKLPSHLTVMAQALAAREMPSFGIQVHGLKGAFSQIGAMELAGRADALESAAKRGDAAYCEAQYDSFKTDALSLCTLVNRLLAEYGLATEGMYGTGQQTKGQEAAAGCLRDHAESLAQAKEAAAGFDSMTAASALTPLTQYRFGSEADMLIIKALGELESFHPRKAVPYITALLDACD